MSEHLFLSGATFGRPAKLCRILSTLVVLACAIVEDGQAGEYRKLVGVTHSTRLDWTFAVAKRSVVDPPPEWVKHVYDSSKQSYEFYGPAKKRRKTLGKPIENGRPGHPLILFVSPRGKAIGWKYWEPVCRRHGMMYAGPNGTVKGDPHTLRIRIVMDVLDDVRRRNPVDPDRTYIAGFYGGATDATKISYRLPEYVGGVIAIAGGSGAPAEPWLKRQLADRLSVVHLVGSRDSRGRGNQRVGWVRSLHPQIVETGTRSKLWTYAGPVHLMPNSSQLGQAVLWLEKDVQRRRQLAVEFPSTSVREPITRQQQAQQVLEDAKKKLVAEDTVYAGLLKLEGIRQRWPDVPAAEQAQRILDQYEERDGPWKKERLADERNAAEDRLAAIRPYTEVDPPRDKVDYPRNSVELTNRGMEHLSRLSQLRYLSLARTDIDGEGFARLPALRELTVAVLGGTRVDDHATGKLSEATKLRALSLSSSRITDKAAHILAGLKLLEYVSVSATKTGDTLCSRLADLDQLQHLILDYTHTTDRGLAELKRSNSLRDMSLIGTRVSDQGLSHLGQMKQLESLNVRSTKVTQQGVIELQEAIPTLQIKWEGNRTIGIQEQRDALEQQLAPDANGTVALW